MRQTGKSVAFLLGITMLIGLAGASSRVRAAGGQQIASTTSNLPTETSEIQAESGPYHFTWKGQQGTLHRDAVGVQPAQNMSLVCLHSEPGPKGYASSQTWFLARDGATFSLLWCYLNESGQAFYCWLYRYPANQLISLHFTGNYKFIAPQEPVAPVVDPKLALAAPPLYAGLDFVYGHWTRQQGTLVNLELHPVRAAVSTPLPQTTPQDPATRNLAEPASVKTLSLLPVAPLYQSNSPGTNDGRTSGWCELHALAYDAAQDPYYLILYTNSTRGYVIDLRRAQTYQTDFGQKVGFKTRVVDPTTGINIVCAIDPTLLPPPLPGDSARPLDVSEVERTLRVLHTALAKYPPALLHHNLTTIYVVRQLADERGQADGFALPEAKRIDLDDEGEVAGYTDAALESTLHHELAHVLVANKIGKLAPDRWQQLNPSGFHYNHHSLAWFRIHDTSEREPGVYWRQGFANEYAMTDPGEDVASLAEFLFSGSRRFWQAVDQNALLQKKVARLIAFYHALDGTFTPAYFRHLTPDRVRFTSFGSVKRFTGRFVVY
jgi:hypothetical protein